VRRGEIWWAALAEPRGSGPGFRRPVLIIQADAFNQTGIRTIVVAVITSNLQRAAAPGNVEISERDSGLPRRSVVHVSQILSIDRGDLLERVGSLPSRRLAEVQDGLRLVLGLGD
jgi:mRNA interferase MazF